MADFDPDAWMAKQGKAATVKAASSFDPDAWMAKQKQPPAPKSAPISPDSQFGPLHEARQEHARRTRELTPGVGGNVAIGGERGFRRHVAPAIHSLGEVAGGLAIGDFRPAWRMAKESGRGVISALAGGTEPESFKAERLRAEARMRAAGVPIAGDVLGRDYNPLRAVAESQAAPIAEAQRQREARYAASPQGQRSAQRLAELDIRAGLDPSYAGKAIRGGTELLTGAAPTLAAAVATRGAILPTALVAGLQSANNPGQMLPQAAGAALPLPSIAPLVRRLRGRGATTAPGTRPTNPQAVLDTQEMPAVQGPSRPTAQLPRVNNYDVETAPTAGLPQSARLPVRERISELPDLYAVEAEPFGVRENLSLPKSYPGAVGPAANDMMAFNALPAATPKAREWHSSGRVIGGAFRTGAQALRTIRTAFDLSAPMSQGAVLTRAHPIKGAQAFGRMMRSLSKKQSDAIDQEILNHPLKSLGDEFDLYIATGGPPEEAFMLKALNKVPGIGASERTYRTYLDSLRLSTWESYVKSLQAAGHTPQNNPTAYKQAAAWINIASGRGSLKPGGRFDLAMTLGGDVLFAPRFLVSKFQLLDPTRYATLAPGARKLVLRDAMTSFGALLGTAGLLTAAGAKVGWNPESDDFLTARWGNHRYDLTGGLKTEVRFLARMAAGTYRQAEGGGNLPGQDPLSVAESWARGKLSPGVGLAIDAMKGQDFKGEKFSEKTKTQLAVETVAPMIVEEFYEAAKDSGLAGMAKSSPAILGQRTSVYPDRAKAQWLDTPPGFGKRMHLEPRRAEDKTEKDETPAEFKARLEQVNQRLSKYGQKLIQSNAYARATAEEQKAMRDYLSKQIKSDNFNAELLDPARILGVIRESAYQKRQKELGRK